MGQQIGRTGQVYGKSNAGAYGDPVVFAATDAIRHLNCVPRKTLNRANSLERKGTPGLTNRFSRHIDAGYQFDGYLSPSGTIKTVPNAHVFLEHGFGVERVGALTTTVAAAPTVNGATLTDATGLVAGDAVLVTIAAGPNAGNYGRIITSVAGADVTWKPALQGAPAVGDAVKDGVTYRLANTLPAGGFNLGRYLADHNWELIGAVVETLNLMFDGNDEVKFSASGPGQDLVKPAQAKPGAYTAVGSPVTGISGYLYKDDTAIKAVKFNFQIANLEELINDSFGFDKAEDHYRGGRRDVTVGIDQRLLTAADLYDLSLVPTDFSILAQAGKAEGRIVLVYAPRVELDIPDIPDDDGKIVPSFRGVCKETESGLDGASVGGNDELIVALL